MAARLRSRNYACCACRLHAFAMASMMRLHLAGPYVPTAHSARHSFIFLGTLHLRPLKWLSQRAKRGGDSKRSNLRLGLFADYGNNSCRRAVLVTCGWTVSNVGHAAQKIARRDEHQPIRVGSAPFLRGRERGTGGTSPASRRRPSSMIYLVWNPGGLRSVVHRPPLTWRRNSSFSASRGLVG